MLDLHQIKENFSQLILQVPQWTLTQFVLWLDLKVAEYKVKGFMVLDDTKRTLPRWIDSDVLHPTSPKHHGWPCLHKHHGKRRRKWRRWHDWGMATTEVRGQNSTAMGGLDMGGNQNNTVEISDDSSDSDFEYVSAEWPQDSSAPGNTVSVPGYEPQRHAPEKTHNRLSQMFLSKLPSDMSAVPKTVVSSEQINTDSVVDDVNQIYISNKSARHKQGLTDTQLPLKSSSVKNSSLKNSSVQEEDDSSRDTRETCTPDSVQIVNVQENMINSAVSTLQKRSAINTHQSERTSLPTELHCHDKSPETEAMVIQDQEEESVDIKPNLDSLEKAGEGLSEKGEEQDSKLEIDVELMPLSPVTSALMRYRGADKHKRRSESPAETSTAKRQTNVVPDLLDEYTKGYLTSGHSKLVWNRVVALCASFLIHACKGQPSSSDYRWLCRTMYDRYPSLGSSKGPNPWSCFNKAVSQKIRHTRFKLRQMGRQPGRMSTNTNDGDEQNCGTSTQNTCMFS